MRYTHKEGETPLDDLSGLRIKIPHITRGQIDDYEAENIQKCLEKYYLSKRKIHFDIGFFKSLHKEMFGQVWSWAGSFRDSATNIGCDPVLVQENLIILQYDLEHFSKDIEGCAIFHHRAVQIHPFKNGNGRWARLLSDLWIKQNTGIKITWPIGIYKESPLRKEYLAALKAADGLEYSKLFEIYKNLVRS